MAFPSEVEKLERRWSENQLGLTFAPLAEAYRKAGETAKALELLETGLAQHPNYIPAHIVRGRCHLDSGADGEAELAFLRVSELDPENVIALKSLAELSERAGRLPEAIHRLELLLEIDRNNEEARGQLERVRELPVVQAAGPAVTAEPLAADSPAGADEPPSGFEPTAEPNQAEVLEANAPRASGEDAFVDTMDPDDLRPGTAAEFQVPSDAETLRPSDERLEDIVLGVEPPDHAQPDVPLAAPEGMLLPPGSEPVEAIETEGFVPVGDLTALMAFIPDAAPRSEAPPPAPPPSEPEGAPEPELQQIPAVDTRQPEAVPRPEPELESEPTAATVEPELVVTETMAEVFLRQGHRELARAVYDQLARRDPENGRIASALAGLNADRAPPALAPAAPGGPKKHFAAGETGGRSVENLFGALLSAPRPTVAAPVHPPTFESPRRASGEPTRPAQESLSLSAVFGDEAAPAGPAGVTPEPAVGEPSFDEFFAPANGSAAEAELPKGPPDAAAGTPAQGPEDLEQFNAWLRGLKR